MAATTAHRTCVYPGCEQPTAAPGSDRAPSRSTATTQTTTRCRRTASAAGGKQKPRAQRAEEADRQPVTLGITRAAELVAALDKLTAQHARHPYPRPHRTARSR